MYKDNFKIFSLLSFIFLKLNNRRKFQIKILFLVIFFSALLETISVYAAVPFLNIVSNANLSIENNLLGNFITFISPESDNLTILPICIFLALSALLASTFKVFCIWYGARLSALIGVDLSCDCFEKNLYQPYEVHLNKNSSQLLSNNTLFINRTVDLLQSSSRFFIASISAIFISIFLFIYNTYFSIITLLTFLMIYVFLAKFVNNKLSKNSKVISSKGEIQIKLMQESLGGIRDIILSNNYQKYVSSYRNLDRKIRLGLGNNDFLNLFPRYAIEGLFLSFIALVTYFLTRNLISPNQLLPIIGIFLIGAQKLLPCIQQCYSSWSLVQGNISSIINVINNLNTPLEKVHISKSTLPLNFKKNINLINTSFKYSTISPEILINTNLFISKGQRIGIVGETGSGKSTLIDILMGLITPRIGKLEIDGSNIFDEKYPQRIIQWRSKIAHVPQNIFLSDSSIAENISFGCDSKKVDLLKVKLAAKKAMLEEFIINQPLKYETMVGENGVQLSGGQKQRIGIARALYRDADLIIFDEATSALDLKTEEKIMNNIYEIKKDITILIISHRETTLKRCDKVFEIKNGSIYPK